MEVETKYWDLTLTLTLTPVTSVKLAIYPLLPKTMLNFEQIGWKSLGSHYCRGGWGGGVMVGDKGMNPKLIQNLLLGAEF